MMGLTYCFFLFIMYLWVNGTCIVIPVNMGDQILGVAWCLSGIIFGSYFDCTLWFVQVVCVASTPALAPLDVVNHHHQVITLEAL